MCFALWLLAMFLTYFPQIAKLPVMEENDHVDSLQTALGHQELS